MRDDRGAAQRSGEEAPSPEIDDENAVCAVCYGVRCHPASLAPCPHTFCRLCVFKCRSLDSGCPLCRVAVDPELQRAYLPSSIAYDTAEDAAIAERYPLAHRAAVERETALEQRLSEKLLLALPLVVYPGSFPVDATGEPVYCIKTGPNTSCTMHFTDEKARSMLESIAGASRPSVWKPDALAKSVPVPRQVGVVCPGGDGPYGAEGFVADTMSVRSLSGSTVASLRSLRRFKVVGDVRLQDDGLQATVELIA